MIVIGFFELVFDNYLATRPHFVGENINIEGSHGRFGFDEFELYPNCLAQNLKINPPLQNVGSASAAARVAL